MCFKKFAIYLTTLGLCLMSAVSIASPPTYVPLAGVTVPHPERTSLNSGHLIYTPLYDAAGPSYWNVMCHYKVSGPNYFPSIKISTFGRSLLFNGRGTGTVIFPGNTQEGTIEAVHTKADSGGMGLMIKNTDSKDDITLNNCVAYWVSSSSDGDVASK